MNQLFASGGQNIGTSASAPVLPMNIQGWFPLQMTGLISLLSKGLSRVFSNTTIWKQQFFDIQPSLFCVCVCGYTTIFFLILFLKLYKIVLVLPNIKMNPPQVYMCSPSWTLLPPPSPYHTSGSSQCTSPKHPVSCIWNELSAFFIVHLSHPYITIEKKHSFDCFDICWQNDVFAFNTQPRLIDIPQLGITKPVKEFLSSAHHQQRHSRLKS